jgi:hypothetical protein
MMLRRHHVLDFVTELGKDLEDGANLSRNRMHIAQQRVTCRGILDREREGRAGGDVAKGRGADGPREIVFGAVPAEARGAGRVDR